MAQVEGKKLTIKYFLNKRIKPTYSPFAFEKKEDEEPMYYPVYTQITYDRKNMQFPARNFGGIAYFSEDLFQKAFIEKKELKGFKNFTGENILNAIDKKTKFIEKAIEYEVITFKQNFSMRGFKSRYSNYEKDLRWCLEEFVLEGLKDQLKDILTVRQYEKLFTMTGEFLSAYLFTQKHYCPTIRSYINTELEIAITSYLHYFHFTNYETKGEGGVEGNRYYLYDWILKNDLKDKVKNFLWDKVNLETFPIFRQTLDAHFEKFEKVLNEYPIYVTEYPSYIKIIDNVVKQNIMKE